MLYCNMDVRIISAKADKDRILRRGMGGGATFWDVLLGDLDERRTTLRRGRVYLSKTWSVKKNAWLKEGKGKSLQFRWEDEEAGKGEGKFT
jgi:hypothetical protein